MNLKSLLAEDLGSISSSVIETLKDLGVDQIDHVQYCDEAYLKLLKARNEGTPYQLLITDLSFIPDHRKTSIKSGEELLQKIKNFSDLKTIVYSVDQRLNKVRSLVEHCNIDAFVCKGRKGPSDLRQAIQAMTKDQKFFSKEIQVAFSNSDELEIEDYDIQLMTLLASGRSKQEIKTHFELNNISPSSISSIEKRQNKLLVHFDARNATHLVGIVKDLGLI